MSWSVYAGRLVYVLDLSVACWVAEFLGSDGKHGVVKGEHDLTMRDLREAPAVILGGAGHQWTAVSCRKHALPSPAKAKLQFIRDSQNPNSR